MLKIASATTEKRKKNLSVVFDFIVGFSADPRLEE